MLAAAAAAAAHIRTTKSAAAAAAAAHVTLARWWRVRLAQALFACAAAAHTIPHLPSIEMVGLVVCPRNCSLEDLSLSRARVTRVKRNS